MYMPLSFRRKVPGSFQSLQQGPFNLVLSISPTF
jgi:hypothetical protein